MCALIWTDMLMFLLQVLKAAVWISGKIVDTHTDSSSLLPFCYNWQQKTLRQAADMEGERKIESKGLVVWYQVKWRGQL